MRHIQGEPRQQGPLSPDSLDEYVSADHPVRVTATMPTNRAVNHLGDHDPDT